MNSHPFGYESGYNYVAGRGDYNDNLHQRWDNQRWEESQGLDQPSWQRPPPMDYQQPFCDAYQGNGYGEHSFDYQQPPPYAYEPPPQHDFRPPYSQAPFRHSPPYNPNPQPPYQPPYEPYEPYIEPPQFQPNYSQEPPLQYSPSPYPSIQEHYDPIYESRLHQEARIVSRKQWIDVRQPFNNWGKH